MVSYFEKIFTVTHDWLLQMYDYLEITDILLCKHLSKRIKQTNEIIMFRKTPYLGRRMKQSMLNRGFSQEFLDLIYHHGGVISGSFLFSLIHPKQFNRPNDIDIFLPESSYLEMEDYFVKSCIWFGRYAYLMYDEDEVKKDNQSIITPFYKIVNYHLKFDYNDNIKKKYFNMFSPIDCRNFNELKSYLEPNSTVPRDTTLDNNTRDVPPVQIIYLKSGISIKRHIQHTFDIDALKNYFDGKRLTINHVSDVISKQGSTKYHVSTLLTGIPIRNCILRIIKYRSRGFTFSNISIRSKIIYMNDLETIECQQIVINNSTVLEAFVNNAFSHYLIGTENEFDNRLSKHRYLLKHSTGDIRRWKTKQNLKLFETSSYVSFSSIYFHYSRLLGQLNDDYINQVDTIDDTNKEHYCEWMTAVSELYLYRLRVKYYLKLYIRVLYVAKQLGFSFEHDKKQSQYFNLPNTISSKIRELLSA